MACVPKLSCLLNDIAIPHLEPGPTWPPARREKKQREREIGVAKKKEREEKVYCVLERQRMSRIKQTNGGYESECG